MRRLALVFALAVLLLGIGALVMGRTAGEGEPAGRPDVEPQLFYVIEPGRLLELDVLPGTGRVKLVCTTRVAEDGGGAAGGEGAGEEVLFGIVVSLSDERDREVWRTPLWFSSSVTIEEPGDGSAPRHRAALVSGQGVLTDERVVEIGVGEVDSAGGTLRVEALQGAAEPVFVRPYRRVRDEGDARMALRTLSDEEKQELAARVGVHSFAELGMRQQLVLATFHWQRMEARGARGIDYRAVKVVLEEVEPGAGEGVPGWHRLDPGRAVALNLRGPATVRVQAQVLPAPGGAEPPAEGRLAAVVVDQRGGVESRVLDVGDDGGSLVAVPPDRVVTLSLANAGRGTLAVAAMTADVPRALFAETAAVLDPATGLYALSPDERVVRLWRVDGGFPPLEVELRPAALDRVRIEARSVGPGSRTLVAELLDGAGRVLRETTIEVEGSTSPYESARPALPSAETRPAGRPTEVEMWYGRGARRLRLSASEAVDVEVSVPQGTTLVHPRPEPAYRLETDGATLRFEPLDLHAWVPLTPLDREQMAVEGREIFMTAQVRLEPLEAGEGEGEASKDLADLLGWDARGAHRPGVAWFPDGEVPRQRLLERWIPPQVPTLETWPAGARTAMEVGRPRTLELAREGRPAAAMRVELWVDDPGLLGRAVTVRVDGREMARVELGAGRVEADVGPLPPGRHRVLIEAPGDGVRVLVDRPPAGEDAPTASLYRARTVYALRQGSAVEATLPVRDGTEVLLLLPYYELPPGAHWPRQLARVAVSTSPEVARPTWTPLARTTPPRMEADLRPRAGTAGFLADRAEGAVVAGEPVPVRPGQDLAGGAARVEITRLDAGDPVWVRLVALGVEAPPRQVASQWIEEVGHASGAWAWADPFRPGPGVVAMVAEAMERPRGPVRAPPEGALAAVRELGWQILVVARRGEVAALPALAGRAAELGFELLPVESEDGRLLVLRDAADEGRGLLIARFGGEDSPVLLQAPHAFSDRDTGALAARLMSASRFRVLQINTRHRYALGRGEGSPPETDVAHAEASWFHALTLGLLDAHERPLLVQLHGFARPTVDDPAIDLVVSGGVRPRSRVIEAFTEALTRGEVAPGVAVYPGDIEVLGARTNVQGRAVAARSAAAFLHLETGPEWRERLDASPEQLRALQRSIEAAAAAHRDAAGEVSR